MVYQIILVMVLRSRALRARKELRYKSIGFPNTYPLDSDLSGG